MSLYRTQELSIRTLCSELKERSSAAGELLPGTPGTLVQRAGTGYEYWYRSYYVIHSATRRENCGRQSSPDVHASRSFLKNIHKCCRSFRPFSEVN
jgi:hypothetical protein